MSQSSVSRVNGWCQLSVSSLWTFSRNGATRPPICHSDVLQVWYTYLQNQNRFVCVNVMNLRSPRTTQLKTVHSAGAKNPAASLNVRLHHKTTKFRSNASVQSCFSMFHFVNFKTFFAIPILYHQIFSLLQHSVVHLCTSLCSASYIVKLCYKNTKFRAGAETVPIFLFYLCWDRKQKPDTADCCDIYVHIFTLFMNTNQQCQSLWKVMRTMPTSTMAKN